MTNSKKYINPNILDEGNQMELIKENEDIMECKVRCNNCGNIVKYGGTRMVVGIDADISNQFNEYIFDNLAREFFKQWKIHPKHWGQPAY